MLKFITTCVFCVLNKLNLTANLVAESLALRQQLLVLNRKVRRAPLKERDRFIELMKQ